MIKRLQKLFGGLAQAVYNIATNEEIGIGFKTYEEMLFNSPTSISPFNDAQWNLIMQWYKIFAYISGSLILIAVVIISYKMIISSINTIQRNEVKQNLLNLCFGGIAIATFPIFIRFLLFLNNTLVNMLVKIIAGGEVNNLLDNKFLSSITTGNPIATALVISMFIYIFVKLNIKFIVRGFTLIVFTIFTPIVVGLWIINKNVTAVAIWSGQIMINVFMQFIYCFLFLLFSSFISASAGWAVTLIWAMMLLPIADVLLNCLQNLTSRIAGLDNNEVAMRGVGLGTALGTGIGYSISAIKTQFSNPNGLNNANGISGFVGRIKNFVNPQISLTDETDYNGNINPIRNVIRTQHQTTNEKITKSDSQTQIASRMTDNGSLKSVGSRIVNAAYQGSKTYLRVGAQMAEGDFSKNKQIQNKNDNNNTYITQKNIDDLKTEKLGDVDEK